MEERDLPSEAELLERYLLTHDAACPTCGYNLRGVTSGACPECAERLSLHVHNADRLGRRRGLLLTVLAWLVLVGGMNTYRAGATVYRAANAPMSPQIAVTTLRGMLNAVPSAATSAVTVQADEIVLEQAIVSTLAQGSVTSTAPTRTTRTMRWRPVTSFAPGAPSWSSVGWTQWLAAGGWSLLTALAVTALAVLIAHRGRAAPAGLGNALLIFAGAGLGGALIWQIVDFVGFL